MTPIPGTGLPSLPPKLPAKQHEAVLTAAQRPDQLVAGRDDRAYWNGEPWFNGRTLAALHAAGYAAFFPQPWHDGDTDWGKTIGGSLYLIPAGREYARVRGNINVHRRKVVIISGVRTGSLAAVRRDEAAFHQVNPGVGAVTRWWGISAVTRRICKLGA
ncbi:hypothetical protein [Streptomyces sp. CNQ-509]|uniref:hypothetical protein n=1 Tax=Streptomyces sp. CNQ-509 TaxID=444103 RepID=UPI00069C47E3|nr:hypothetical protein [Streptomyces sp. CNQ-509]